MKSTTNQFNKLRFGINYSNKYQQIKLLYEEIQNEKKKIFDKLKFQRLQEDMNEYIKENTKKIIPKISKVNKITEKIIDVLQSNGLDIHVKIYGSYFNKMPVDSSDLDLVIYNKTDYDEKELLVRMQEILSNTPGMSLIASFYANDVSVQRYNTDLDIQIDVSVFNECHTAYTSFVTVDFFRERIKNFDLLIICFKEIAFRSGVNDAYKGGINSYGYILFFACYLIGKRILFSNDDEVKIDNCGEILIEFMIYLSLFPYGDITLGIKDYNLNQIELTYRQNIFKDKLCIFDPNFRSLIVTKASYKFETHKKLFSELISVFNEIKDLTAYNNRNVYEEYYNETIFGKLLICCDSFKKKLENKDD